MPALGLVVRGLIAVAALGMAACALVLLLEAGTNILAAAAAVWRHDVSQNATSLVMKAIDECLFAAILVLLGARLVTTFVARPAERVSDATPDWLRPSDIGALKSTFCQTILVYLIVDFATDMATADTKLEPGHLVLPLAIAILALALRLMPHESGPAHH